MSERVGDDSGAETSDGRFQDSQAARRHPPRSDETGRGRREPAGSDESGLDDSAMVVAAVTAEQAVVEAREYITDQDGTLVRRRRAFGLGPEHLAVLTYCMRPRSVMEVAADLERIQRQAGLPPAFPAIAELTTADEAGPGSRARSMDEIVGLHGPLAFARAVLADLHEHGLLHVRPFPDPAALTRHEYGVVLDGLRALDDDPSPPSRPAPPEQPPLPAESLAETSQDSDRRRPSLLKSLRFRRKRR